jgi:hypothetical protein
MAAQDHVPIEGQWRLVTDQVMGGVSSGRLTEDTYAGRPCVHLTGQVSTANNGGFVQMALDLGRFDASAYAGIVFQIAGNGETYNVHLRTSDLWLPWQSYRASFVAGPDWQEVRIPFARFEPYRTGRDLRSDRLVRIGLVGIGRDFAADFCVGEIAFMRRTAAD